MLFASKENEECVWYSSRSLESFYRAYQRINTRNEQLHDLNSKIKAHYQHLISLHFMKMSGIFFIRSFRLFSEHFRCHKFFYIFPLSCLPKCSELQPTTNETRKPKFDGKLCFWGCFAVMKVDFSYSKFFVQLSMHNCTPVFR